MRRHTHTFRLTAVGVLVVAYLAAVVSAPLSAEESDVYSFWSVGLTKAALGPVLVRCISGVCVDSSTAAITLETLVSGTDYYWAGLPDATAGTDETYALSWQVEGVIYTYRYPDRTQTPQTLIASVAYRVSTSPLNLAIGSTFPPAGTTVFGLTSDPTGATATFTMWGSGVTPLLDGVTATCDDVDAHTDGTWSMTCQHAWLATETEDPCSSCRGRFTITLPTGEILGSPPSPNDLRIVIHK